VYPVTFTSEERLIKLGEVLSICAMSRSSMYDAIKKGQFPAPVKLSTRSCAWVKSEVLQWVESRIEAARDKQGDKGSCDTGRKIFA
jgi:prophage regulatory protein